MRRAVLLLLVLLAGAGAWAWVAKPFGAVAATEGGAYRMALVDRGTIASSITATGTINPLSTVIVGSQLSGQVIEINADFNDQVTANQVLARLNTDQIRARHDGARADAAQARAQVQMQEASLEKNVADQARATATMADLEAQRRRAEALLNDARQTLDRQQELNRRGVATETALQNARTQAAALEAALDSSRAQFRSSEAQIRSLEADRLVIQAQLVSARALVQQREAVIRQIEVDIRNAEIRSPVNGVVVQRNVELGQTVAASLQAPTLFLVAEDLSTMRIFANVDETDVGRLRRSQTVSFTVNAFPGRSFDGRVEQVRLGSQTVQNVVIYTAVITVDNPGGVLLPGMTANLRVLTEERRDVLRVPNAALRWRPPVEATTAAAPPASAPANPFGAGPPGGGPPGGGAAAQAQAQGAAAIRQFNELVEGAKAELQLSPEQSQRLDAAIAEVRRGARGQLGPDSTVAQRREAFQRLREEIATRIEAVLTEAQRPAFAEVRRRFVEQRGGQGGGPMGRVYVIGAEGRPEPVALRLGATDGSFTEVVAAPRLREGLEVVVAATPRAAGSAFSVEAITQRVRGWFGV